MKKRLLFSILLTTSTILYAVAPTADAGPDKTVQVNHPVTISGSGSSDSDGTIVAYKWIKQSNNQVLATTETFIFTPTGTRTKTLVLTVTDNDGETASDEMVLTVTDGPVVGDNIPPTADAGPDKTVQVNNTITISGISSDSDGTIVKYEWKKKSNGQVLANTESFDFTPTGTLTKTLVFTVTDDQGATASDEMVLMVTDVPVGDTPPANTIAPVITLNGSNPMNLNVGDSFTDPGATAQDDVDGTVSVAASGSVDTSTAGTYTITYTATDSAGNTATATRTVNVVSVQPTTGTTYEDAEDGNTVGWRVYDNNPAGATITNVYDNHKASRVIQLNGSGTDNGYMLGGAWDNSLEKTIKWSMKYSTWFYVYISVQTQNGQRYLQYTASNTDGGLIGTYVHLGLGADSSNGTWQTFTRDLQADLTKYEPGNELLAVDAFMIRGSGLVDDIELFSDIGAVDSVPPVITLNGSNPMNLNVGDSFTDPGATAQDDVDGTVSVSASGSVDTSTAGTYAITYTATDSAGNTATETRTVNVMAAPLVDTTAPVITLNGSNPMYLNVGDSFTDPGATAQDDIDGTVSVSASGSVDTSTAGTYTITYTATDSAGNTATATRNVTIYETEMFSGGISLSFDDQYVDSWYAARDLFNKYNAKVTFFVSYFHHLSEAQIEKLRILKSDGHEIASHSLRHLDITGKLYPEGGYGPESEVGRYIQEEILPSIELMSAAGLPPLTFAVPYSRRNQPYEDAIMEKFSYVRNGAWVGDRDITTVQNGYYTCQDKMNHRTFVDAFYAGERSINEAINYAALTNSIVLMFHHDINDSSPHDNISLEKLEAILSLSKQLGLKFYTTSELGTLTCP